jgi:acyl-coenzyme A thioesterase PaaI-like protein
LRDAVSALNDLVLFGELNDTTRQILTDQVNALTSQRSPADGAHVESRTSTVESWGDYRWRSPFTGTANPRSPGLTMRIDTEAAIPAARGAVTVAPAFAGPPGLVHGGIIAGLLDEAIGWLAAATAPDAAVVTGKLAVRFRAPTPVQTPLELQVTVTRQTSRSMTVEAEVLLDGHRTASAEALMVVRR